MTLNLPLVEILSSNQTIKRKQKKWIFGWIWILGRQTEDNMEDIQIKRVTLRVRTKSNFEQKEKPIIILDYVSDQDPIYRFIELFE